MASQILNKSKPKVEPPPQKEEPKAESAPGQEGEKAEPKAEQPAANGAEMDVD